MAKANNHYILIMCGGSGPRLWPLSRADHPKQFLKLFGDKSLLQNTVLRYQSIVPKENIYIISQQKYLKLLYKDLDKYVYKSNIICEPDKKNTAMAIVYGTSVIAAKNPNAIITAAPADHFISKKVYFKKAIKLSANCALKSKIATIGIKPTFANPGFGYIISETHGEVREVVNFVEKPTVTDAQILIRKDALWNSGIYTFTRDTLLKELSIHEPIYAQIYESISHSNSLKNIVSNYKKSPSLSIDKALSERSHELVTIKSKFEWNDIGEWRAIWEHLTQNSRGIATLEDTIYSQVNSNNCLVRSSHKKLVGLVGVNNLAIIDTPDSLLICNLQDTYSVRNLVKDIANNPKLKNYFLKS